MPLVSSDILERSIRSDQQ